MNDSAVPTVSPHRPIFVLGERAAAIELVQALGQTPAICAVPPTRLLTDLVTAVERCIAKIEPLPEQVAESLRPAAWYGDVQAGHLRASGKTRTIEFSGLSIIRLCSLFPSAQFLVVRQLKRAIPRSRRLPSGGRQLVLEIDSADAVAPETLERALAFLGEFAEPVEVDLSDHRVGVLMVTGTSSSKPARS